MSATVCIAGGGTGGHLMPALALADAMRGRWPDLTVRFIGAERGLEAKMLPERGEEVLLLSMHAVSGAGIWQRMWVVCAELPRAVRVILKSWREQKPKLVIGVGGYASAMGVVAAIIARIPVLLYEQNAIPGMVNRQLARFARRVLLGMEAAARHLPTAKAVVCGNLVRSEIATARWQPHEPPQLLVLGGSQGARFLNETMPLVAAVLQKSGCLFTVRHQCGRDNEAAVSAAYQQGGIAAEVVPFCHDMVDFYTSGNLLVARAGAMTVAESAVVGVPTIFIPLPGAADDHQFHNAKAQADDGAAVVLRQEEATPESLASMITVLLQRPEKLQQMHDAAVRHAPRHAADKMLTEIAPFLEEAA
ncbi:MAG: undecaprenyldiphospho-muramoylpentapeptide beta-N-acetylglucosaminyltransferase [Mariprofundales bacterium]|nr:undecaprenyldiphospho-muramoylpentapeptide beta-N-acetylglucosaminyltransferase [Mariprofundales bacterium]